MTLVVYYNEFDPYAAEWLRNLIAAGLIPEGEVDERSIVDVQADDLRGFTQWHFFAGIGGWSHALRLAGWPDDRPILTGSCPCQPFSSAGKRKGKQDDRHLWPHLFRLIRELRPAIAVGEQVASKDGLSWIDGVCDDLETAGYAVGAADLCCPGVGTEREFWVRRGGSASRERVLVGPPHIRQRLYWVAIATGVGLDEQRRDAGRTGDTGRASDTEQFTDGGGSGRLAHCVGGGVRVSGCGEVERAAEGVQGAARERAGVRLDPGSSRGGASGIPDAGRGERQRVTDEYRPDGHGAAVGGEEATDDQRRGPTGGVGESGGGRCGKGDAVPGRPATGTGLSSPYGRVGDADIAGREGRGVSGRGRAGQRDSWPDGAETGFGTIGSHFWTDYRIVPCLDGKARRVESGTECLVDGFWHSLAAVFTEKVQEAIQEVTRYAKTANASPAEVVSLVQGVVRQEEIWTTGADGRVERVQEEEVLFDLLCRVASAFGGTTDGGGVSEAGTQDGPVGLRGVRCGEGERVGSPHGRQPDEQRNREPATALLELSRVLARCAEEIAEVAAAENAGTLPVKRRGGAPAYRLAGGRTGTKGQSRAKILKGLGNAIVPQVAAEFMRSVMEVIDDRV